MSVILVRNLYVIVSSQNKTNKQKNNRKNTHTREKGKQPRDMIKWPQGVECVNSKHTHAHQHSLTLQSHTKNVYLPLNYDYDANTQTTKKQHNTNIDNINTNLKNSERAHLFNFRWHRRHQSNRATNQSKHTTNDRIVPRAEDHQRLQQPPQHTSF